MTFPYTITDDIVANDLIDAAAAAFPPPDEPRWHTFDAPHEQAKQQLDGAEAWQLPVVGELLNVMASPRMCDRITDWTGIADLLPDATGGGLHQTLPGGYLGMHTDSTSDFNERGLYRRINALLFLNRGWEPAWGGSLVLDDGPDGNWRVDIEPVANRLVVFETTPATWHGHPQPWAGPTPRRSLAMYYYTVAAPPALVEHKPTYFREDAWEPHAQV